MKKCKNCMDLFRQTRSNQLYCNKKCRNAFNNKAYVDRTIQYKKMADGVRRMDYILYRLQKTGKVVYLSRNNFNKQGIYTTKARQLIYKDDVLAKVTFLTYQLVHVKEDLYKIEKL